MTREGWEHPPQEGYVDSVQIAGTLIAPILAGFAVTILALLLGTPGTGEVDPVRWREPVLAVLLTSALVLISSAQAAITARASHVRPDELMTWRLWPGATGVDDERLDAIVAHQHRLARSTRRATSVCRHAYNVGTLLFFVAVALLLVPGGALTGARQVVIGVATATVAVELAWATATSTAAATFGDRLPALAGLLAAFVTAAAVLLAASDGTASALAAAVVAVGAVAALAAGVTLLRDRDRSRRGTVVAGAGLVGTALVAGAGAVLLFAGERAMGAPLSVVAGGAAVGLLGWAISSPRARPVPGPSG